MFYLEDYLEEIEQVPTEVIHSLTLIRELDLSVQNTIDLMRRRSSDFFSKAASMSQQERDTEFEDIFKTYSKAVDESNEKINLAKDMADLVNRCLRKIRHEMAKFKAELEADNPGITEHIERRVDDKQNQPTQDGDAVAKQTNIFKRGRGRHLSYENPLHNKIFKANTENIPTEILSDESPPPKYAMQLLTSSSHPQPPFTIEQVAASNSTIAAAASQAIIATQQMQHGRRTASMKASFEAVQAAGLNTSSLSNPFIPDMIISSKELMNAAQAAIAVVQETTKKRRRGRGRRAAASSSIDSGGSSSSSIIKSEQMMEEEILDIDENEPRYCICNEVAFGDMVACDNKTCPYEWYHYGCVGVTEPPKGKWYCPQCIGTVKRRGGYRKSYSQL